MYKPNYNTLGENVIGRLADAQGNLHNMVDGTVEPTKERLEKALQFINEAVQLLRSNGIDEVHIAFDRDNRILQVYRGRAFAEQDRPNADRFEGPFFLYDED